MHEPDYVLIRVVIKSPSSQGEFRRCSGQIKTRVDTVFKDTNQFNLLMDYGISGWDINWNGIFKGFTWVTVMTGIHETNPSSPSRRNQ